MKLIITGGSGFIGSALIRKVLKTTHHEVLNIDKLTYAANPRSLKEVEKNPRYSFLQADICDIAAIQKAFNDFKPDAIFHLAAESHVDRSISGSNEFINTNINGTHTLLSVAQQYWKKADAFSNFRFIHVSTDEVYGSLKENDPKFSETTAYAPNSPYSASKASSDHLARSWFKTYGLPTIITHCSNNYGPWQNTEKLIPLMVSCAIQNKALPVYGKGENIRDWIYVEDHVRGLLLTLKKGIPGKVYNMGGDSEIKNINLVKSICKILDKIHPRKDNKSYTEQIKYVEDRLGHDYRYAIDNTHINKELDWHPVKIFEEGLLETITWYLEG